MLKPIRDRIVIKEIKEEDKTSGGILLPESAKGKPSQGRVVSVGSGRIAEDGSNVPLEVKEGDLVVYAPFAGSKVTSDGHDYLIIREGDILSTVE